MDNKFIQHIIKDFKDHSAKVFLIENNDRFLYREDVIKELNDWGFEVSTGTTLEQRFKYELKGEAERLILLSQDNNMYLEDIKRNSIALEWSLAQYLKALHIPSVIQLDLGILDEVYKYQPHSNLNRSATQDFVDTIKDDSSSTKVNHFDCKAFSTLLDDQLSETIIDWTVISRLIANGICESIGKPDFEAVYQLVNKVNIVFQEDLVFNYKNSKNSSYIKKPKIVTKILDYLNYNFNKEKVALIVIDGMSFWQYHLLKEKLNFKIDEDVIYSWIPSITQLSRQAIFRGDIPKVEYKQGPTNEKRLWKDYWSQKGFHDFEIAYQHENNDISKFDSVSKLAMVFKDLDDKMHSSTDYVDLLSLTQNWIERSKIIDLITELHERKFNIFITTDHGNIQARGWRGLQGREKLGTNKSGSRSERHIEYTEQWLSDDLMLNNPDLKNYIVSEDQAIYFKNDLSFSNRDSLVTHGGAHLLEVLIPFIEIKYEQ